ncbi:MAG: trypsin-like peptidase domain-containing protein [Anaerolineaceae bacterium]|nr:trypsin-like peptidase domain-containing protein [Anaerolineaceae bacterium]
MLLLAGFAGFIGAVTGSLLVYQYFLHGEIDNMPVLDVPAEVAPPQIAVEVNTTEIQTAITQSVQRVGPSVVTVVGNLPAISEAGPSGLQQVSGSGLFISQDGYILTNNHVVQGMENVTVTLYDGSQQAAAVVGTDPFADLAVLKSEGPVPAVATLGNSDVLNPGETVIAIGSPLGDFKNTVTVGVVSATGRSIDTGAGYAIEDLIQTDAAINQGNSGGPLLNLAGEVIGINTLVVRGSSNQAVAEGLGFAIPVNTVRAVSSQIISQGYFTRPYLGIRWQALTPNIAAVYNLGRQWGAYVTNVVPGSPAELAGVQAGDIITRIDDISIDAQNSFINTLYRYNPDDSITLELQRDGSSLQVNVTLGESNTP